MANAGDEPSPTGRWAHDRTKEESEELDDNTRDARLDQSSGRSVQKRRRVTRACDECRRKKIKCDGKQPCTHCTVYSYDCTYDQPSHRRRNPTPQYLESLEHRLHRAETLLSIFLPNLDTADPALDDIIEQHFAGAQNAPRTTISTPSTTATSGKPSKTSDEDAKDPNLEAMMNATGQLDMNEKGDWQYHGHSSGLSFFRRVKEQFGPDLIDRDVASPFAAPKKSYALGSPEKPPKLSHDFGEESSASSLEDLPSKEVAKQLCSHALDDAGAIMICVHQPTFYKHLDRVYDRAPEEYNNEDHRFLPLLYAVMALGCLFASDEDCDLEREGYMSLTDAGYVYFWSSRQLLDVTDCRDLTSLQAIIFMILFLQCSAKLSTCYSYIGIALRSAMRMGLHRSFRDSFSPIEAETRKRVFWVIRKMDIYVGAMLGLPQTLSEEDLDQDYPLEVDDQNITENGILPQPDGLTANICAANAAFKMTRILTKIVRCIYPIKGFQNNEQNPSRVYSISYSTVRDIENELKSWESALPPLFKPGVEAPPPVKRIQQLLRMAYAHAQMMLYRPFLHYVSSERRPEAVDQRSWYCAAASVEVGRNIIHITAEMKKSGLLVGSYWFIMYTTFFAILSLVYYAMENPDKAADVMRDARIGKDTLASLAKRSMAADRCSVTLSALFEELKDRLEHEEPTTAAGKLKKREAVAEVSEPHASDGLLDPSESGHGARRASGPPRRDNIKTRHGSSASQPRHSKQASQSSSSSFSGHIPANSQSLSQSKDSSLSSSNQANMSSMIPDSHDYGQQRQQHSQHSINPQAPRPRPQQMAQQAFPSVPIFPEMQYPDGGFGDLSSIMFPSADPFAYPNQPMTSLERNYGYNNAQSFAPNLGQHDGGVLASTAMTDSVSADDNMDVQLFGPFSSYMMQQNPHNEYGSSHNMNNMAHTAMSTPMTGSEMWNQQARSHGLPGLYFDDFWTQQGRGGV